MDCYWNIFSIAENDTAINESTIGQLFSFKGKTNPTHLSVSLSYSILFTTRVASSPTETIRGAPY